AERAGESLAGHPARSHPLAGDDLACSVGAEAIRDGELRRARQKVDLLLELARHRDERAVRQVGEAEPRIEGAAIVALPARLTVGWALVGDRREREPRDTQGVRGRVDRLVLRIDGDGPVAVRLP